MSDLGLAILCICIGFLVGVAWTYAVLWLLEQRMR